MLNFSGGMQQKIIIARWLLLEPRILILDEPTKGVDIATRSSIYDLLRQVAARGVAIVVVSSDFEELLGLSDRVVVISDGRTIADLPAGVLDEEKLTLLAAPRTSMRRNTEVLQSVAAETGGTGFWALLDGDRMICLNVARAGTGGPDIGFGPGDAKPLADTRIPTALRRREPSFVAEAEGSRATMLLPLRSQRGHDLGWVGLTVDAGKVPPDVAAIRRTIDALAQSL
jgi:ribose transport system ATP-binding protein/rhamnose transport system ATP-binding protein